MQWMMIFLIKIMTATLAMAQAPNASMSLDELLKRRDITVQIPSVQMRGVAVPVHQICVDGDSLRPFEPYRNLCPKQLQGNCEKPERVYLSTPITYLSTYCGEYEEVSGVQQCKRMISEVKQIPLSYKVQISQKVFSENVTMFSKSLQLEACP